MNLKNIGMTRLAVRMRFASLVRQQIDSAPHILITPLAWPVNIQSIHSQSGKVVGVATRPGLLDNRKVDRPSWAPSDQAGTAVKQWLFEPLYKK